MTHSVPLWNKSKSEADLTIKPPHDLGLPKAKLITVPWDPLCEEVRWALTRHGTPFVEYSYPWPLHIFATLEYSDPIPHKQQTEVPIFVNYKNEVYKRSSTDIFMYLYAHSFNTPLKIYSAPRALDLQEYFHKNLTPAVTRIYLSIILSSKKLTQKYLIGNTHLNTLRAIQATTWPIIRIAMYFWFGLSQKKIECAWADIEIVFTRVEDELANQGGKYIAAQTFTAADISFASHATFVLFPNDEDDENSENDAFGAIGCIVPSLKEIPKNVSEKVRKLRGRVAGQHAMKMWMNERGFASKPDGYRSFPSKYCKENNPWWSVSNGAKIKQFVYSGIFINFFWLTLAATAGIKSFTVAVLAHICIFAFTYYSFILKTRLHTNLKQILFILRGNFEPTQRDKVEAAQLETEKHDSKMQL